MVQSNAFLFLPMSKESKRENGLMFRIAATAFT